jgi:hypothetical protein
MAFDFVEVGQVGGQVLRCVVILRNAPQTTQFHEPNAGQSEILRGFRRGNSALVKEPQDNGFQRGPVYAVLGSVVKNPLRNRDVHFYFHGIPIVPL